MQRYIIIEDQPNILNVTKRELVLLKAKPCLYRNFCKFCDYYNDNIGLTQNEIISFNKKILPNISGKFGVLDVINSGSIFEVPKATIDEIKQIAIQNGIHTIYVESFILYIKRILPLKTLFLKDGISLRFRLGLETFNEEVRTNILGKKIDHISLHGINQIYYAANLLVGVEGQTKADIMNDIEEGLSYFPQIRINIFCKNTRNIGIDYALIDWFKGHAMQKLKGDDRIEIFLDNDIL